MSETYKFDESVQESIVAMLCRDPDFCKKTTGLIEPEYFEAEDERFLAKIAIDHFGKYDEPPGEIAMKQAIRNVILGKKIRKDLAVDVVKKLAAVFEKEIVNRKWILDNVCEFATQQAMTNAILRAADILAREDDPKRFEKASEAITRAAKIADYLETPEDDDYFAGIEERTNQRKAEEAGEMPASGITTGIPELDAVLDNKGYGISELSVWMGAAKIGKSFILVQAGGSAVIAGKNVLHVTLENSLKVCQNRYDAFFSEVAINDRFSKSDAMRDGVIKVRNSNPGILKIRWFPSGQFRPRDLVRLLEEYSSQGILFDEVVIDYLDIAEPDIRTDNTQENHKSLWVAARGIAGEWKFALVTATQTNRTGASSAVARSTDVAESFDKIRTADVVFSMNRTEDEKAEKKARIYLAAGRNQEDGITLNITQRLDIARSVYGVESVE